MKNNSKDVNVGANSFISSVNDAQERSGENGPVNDSDNDVDHVKFVPWFPSHPIISGAIYKAGIGFTPVPDEDLYDEDIGPAYDPGNPLIRLHNGGSVEEYDGQASSRRPRPVPVCDVDAPADGEKDPCLCIRGQCNYKNLLNQIAEIKLEYRKRLIRLEIDPDRDEWIDTYEGVEIYIHGLPLMNDRRHVRQQDELSLKDIVWKNGAPNDIEFGVDRVEYEDDPVDVALNLSSGF